VWIRRRFDPIRHPALRHRGAGQIDFVLALFLHNSTQERPRGLGRQTTLPALFSTINFPFFASFFQNEPNSYFS
jgi:hypothetical protein